MSPESTRVRDGMPSADLLFELRQERHGLRLPLVFGNHSPGGLCPYYRAGRCHHCDIGAGEGLAFDVRANRARLEWFEHHYARELPLVTHLVLYNSGSMLSSHEMPLEMLLHILAFASSLGRLEKVSLDSREAFITRRSVETVVDALPRSVAVHPIIGLESSSEWRRNGLLDKRMPRRALQRAVRELRAVATSVGRGRVGFDVNVLVGGPGTRADNTVADAVASARFAFELAELAELPVAFNLHPYYASQRGRARFPEQLACGLQLFAAAAAAIARERDERALDATIFLGWVDEGHDTEREWEAEMGAAEAILCEFNRTQDASALARLA